MMKKKKKLWLAWGALIIVIGITVFLYLGSRPAPSMDLQTTAVPSIQFTVEREDLSQTIEVKGKSEYAEETYVYPPFAGEVKEWKITHGAPVESGQLLFTMKTDDLMEEIARLELDQMQQQIESKYRAIQQAVMEEQLDGSADYNELLQHASLKERDREMEKIEKRRMELLTQQLGQLQQRVEKSSVYADQGGLFLFSDTERPRFVNEDEPVGKIVDTSQIVLSARVSEYDVFKIEEGMSAEVTVDALPDQVIPGVVELISPFPLPGADGQKTDAEFEVRNALEADEMLMAGLNLTARIQSAVREQVLTVPTLTVMRENHRSYVYIWNGEAVEKRFIRTGLVTPEKTEVVEGLEEGETVILQ
jgi:macrolide-specific efflux system membrane fusion protein